MEILIPLLTKISFAIAVYAVIIRLLAGWVSPVSPGNCILGRALSFFVSVVASKIYLIIMCEFMEFSEFFALVFFFAFLIGNMIIAGKIFSLKNRRVINYDQQPSGAGQTPTRVIYQKPITPRQITTRPKPIPGYRGQKTNRI